MSIEKLTALRAVVEKLLALLPGVHWPRPDGGLDI